MSIFDYDLIQDTRPTVGLVVLQSDERIEQDFRRMMPQALQFFVTRVPSAPDVSSETLARMEQDLPGAVGLLPRGLHFDAVGYGCTSGTAQIGVDRIADLVRGAADVARVTEPVSALVAACGALGLKRLAFLSPYVETVSARLRGVLARAGIETPVFGSFAEAEEAKVVRITGPSIMDAARQLAGQGGVDGVFLSCTNLNTLDLIAPLEAEIGLPVLSSNLVLGWHLCQLASAETGGTGVDCTARLPVDTALSRVG